MPALTSAQMRAARGLLNWSAEKLAVAAGVGIATVRRAETKGVDRIDRATSDKIVTALMRAGIRLLDADEVVGEGVRFDEPQGGGSAPEPSA